MVDPTAPTKGRVTLEPKFLKHPIHVQKNHWN